MRQRTVCLNNDVVFLQPVDDIPAVAPWMNLILSNVDLAAVGAVDVFLKFLKMVDSVVRDSDRFDLACFLGFCQCAPRAESSFFAAVGCMNQDPISLVPL